VVEKPPNLEELAVILEESDDYRILRRMRPRDRFEVDGGCDKLIGIVLDVETTGLDHESDEIIELAMVKFEFAPDGRIFQVLGSFEQLREPSVPIPPEVTKLTGIDAAMVAGRAIDAEEVDRFAASAVVVIAHNAGFDRKFVEKAFPIFATKAWACSFTQVDWKAEGFDGAKLAYLLAGCGQFHDGHRATEDCHALLEVLSRPLLMTGELGLKRLLDKARQPTHRIWAENSPFETKDKLRLRGYRWGDGADGRPRAWWTDVGEGALAEELRYLRSEIYQYEADIFVRRVSAFDRFSNRV
jgi:DNA polymerase-3 subunit epsilon